MTMRERVPDERAGEAGTPARPLRPLTGREQMLALQRSAGNRAVGRLLQRRPVVSQRGEDALDDYEALWKEPGSANQVNATVWRSQFMSRVQKALGAEMERLAAALSEGKHPSEVGLDLDGIEARIEQLRDELWTEHESAREVWAELQAEVVGERSRLLEQADFEAVEALKVLDAQFAETKRIADRVGTSLVSEDMLVLDDMLTRDKHVKLGRLRSRKEERAAEEDLATVEAEEEEDARDLDDDDSVLKTAWDVLGWDSVGEFAADVALSVITLGVAKYLRVAAKGARAARRAEKIRHLRKVLKARRAARAKRRFERARFALKLFRSDAVNAFREQRKWLGENWPKVGRKFATDIAAMGAHGSLDNLATTAGRRAAKEFLNSRVMEFFGKDDKDERRILRLAWASLQAGREDRGRKLTHIYLLLNVRRRLLVNTLYYASISGGQLRLPTDAPTLKRIGLATAGESVQDLITAIPFFDAPVIKDAVETARKYVVKEIEGMVT
jgi:hypothetical protein